MAGNMEDILMGGGSDSDDSDDNTSKQGSGQTVTAPGGGMPGNPTTCVTQPSITTAAAAPNNTTSKSELSNRLKNLYATPPTPTAAVANDGSQIAFPRGGIHVSPLPAAPRTSTSTSAYSQPALPGPTPAPVQRPPYSNHTSSTAASPLSSHIPAPLPKARTATRAAPPANRVASVPPPTLPYQQHLAQQQQQQQQQQYHAPNSRPPSSLNQYPPTHVGPTSRPGSARPPQQSQTQQPQQMGAPPPNRMSLPSQIPNSISSSRIAVSTAMPQHQQASRSSSQSSATSVNAGNYNLADAEKKDKEKFLMFTRVLMKYLEQRDAKMHAKAKAIIKVCYDKNKLGDPMFKSLTHSMKARLRSTVGEVYWKKANDYLEHFFQQKQVKQQHTVAADTSVAQPLMPGHATAGGPPHYVDNHSTNPPMSGAAPLRPHMTQSQAAAAAAMKMPMAATSRSIQEGTPTSLSAASSNPSTAVTTASSINAIAIQQNEVVVAYNKKKEMEDKKREQRNAINREKQRKKREQQNLLLAKSDAAMPSATSFLNATLSAPVPSESSSSSGFPSSVPSIPTPTTGPSAIADSSQATSVSTMNKKKDVLKSKKPLRRSSSSLSFPPKKKPLTTLPEYNIFMEQIDHSVLIDAKNIPLLLSKDNMSDINLNHEQRALLYGEKVQLEKVQEIAKAAAQALHANVIDVSGVETGVLPLPPKVPSVYQGWEDRNVVSSRLAWAKVRLPEVEKQRVEKEQREKAETIRDKPMSATSELKIGSNQEGVPSTMERAILPSLNTESNGLGISLNSSPKNDDEAINHTWFNEARAAQDPTLALLSEATELYLKSSIEQAIRNARLRQNLDGVRLWHTLQSHHAESKSNSDSTPPPAMIRLGCDVRRQIALAEGNAAKTYQRMEEAISSENEMFHSNQNILDLDKVLLESTSMADLSRKPPLKSAIEAADRYAKRKFQIFGGKYSQEAPLGRVPKRAMVTLQDFPVGIFGNRSSTIHARRKRFVDGLML